MLILQPGLMANMDDDYLIRSLECEPAIMRTPVELELMARCERLSDELAEARALLNWRKNSIFQPKTSGRYWNRWAGYLRNERVCV